MICLTLKPSQTFFVYRVQSKEKDFIEKELFKGKGSGGLNKMQKRCFLTAFPTAITKDHTMSIRKHTNELKVHKKTMRTAIKQDLIPDLNPHDYTLWGVLEKKLI